MTGLLVSVRDAAEAEICLRAGVDLIDVKEPLRGSLGAADPDVIGQVLAVVQQRKPVSAALGELLELDDAARDNLAALPAGLRFAKLGLAGAAGDGQWPAILARAWETLPQSVAPVAVAYADWRAAAAPSPSDVLEVACNLRCAAVLLDTWDKRSGDLFAACGTDEIAQLIAACRSAGLISVIGGSLKAATICRVAALGPDYVAVRGAACGSDRTGSIDPARVAALRQALETGRGGEISGATRG